MKKIKISLKNIVRFVVLTPISIYLLYSVFYFFTHEINHTYNDCGIIKSKSADEVTIKYGSRTELYLNIEFEKTGFESIYVDASTYFKYSVGDRICFELNEDYNGYHQLLMLIGAIVIIVFCILSIIFLILYMLPESW